MNQRIPYSRTLMLGLFLALLLSACVVDPNGTGNVTPRADLIFTVVDESGTPVSNAQIFLFPFRTPYEDFVATNPEGDPSITPNVDAEDAATTNGTGMATFSNRPLDGTSSPQGATFIHQPNPVYFRVQAERNGSFLTNDSNNDETYRLAFPDLEAGEVILEEIEVVLR